MGRWLIMGGPGFGKSSVVRELERRGYCCYYDPCTPEFFRGCMAELGTRDTHNYELNRRVLLKRIDHFLSSTGMCFFDRGIPDSLAYMENAPEEFWELARKHRYMNRVFVAPPWERIHETNAGRHESFEEAVELHNTLLRVYTKLNYELVELPLSGVARRAEFILARV